MVKWLIKSGSLGGQRPMSRTADTKISDCQGLQDLLPVLKTLQGYKGYYHEAVLLTASSRIRAAGL